MQDMVPGVQERFLGRWQVADTTGAVVVVDVLRAFTTAAYAFAAGAERILLVDSVADALDLKARQPDLLIVGEDAGRRPEGFDLPNSPVEVRHADIAGRTLVQRTSAGTPGAVAARSATRLWCTGLVTASATARAVTASGLGEPTYVITGLLADRPDRPGEDDRLTAEAVERVRLGEDIAADKTAEALVTSDEAARTLAHVPGDAHPDDVAYAARVDLFDFAMEVHRRNGRLELRPSVG